MNPSDKHPSFTFQNMNISFHPEVYEPAEDTFLMIETIKINPHQEVLEIGAGTGIISLYCAQKGANVICTDINPFAISIIKKNIDNNLEKLTGSIEVRQGDLFDTINDKECFDLIIFNPPYVPTTIEEKKGISSWYAKSFDGGPSGLRVTKRFILQVKPYLKHQGYALFITSSFTKKKIIDTIIDQCLLSHQVIKKLRCDDEMLSVHMLFRNNQKE
jgi:release factor glutamine methyltransferase